MCGNSLDKIGSRCHKLCPCSKPGQCEDRQLSIQTNTNKYSRIDPCLFSQKVQIFDKEGTIIFRKELDPCTIMVNQCHGTFDDNAILQV